MGIDLGIDPRDSLPSIPAWTWHFNPEKARKMREEHIRARTRRADEFERLVHTFDVGKPAYQLSKELPWTDLQVLSVVNSDNVPIERRAKLLQVLFYRKPPFSEGVERQRWIRDSVFREPKLFDQLSMSTDKVKYHGATMSPASQILNVMNVDFAMAWKDNPEARMAYEKELAKWPAETRGRMLYHAQDAISHQKYDFHQNVEEMLGQQYRKMSDDEKEAFKAGFAKAKEANELPKDFTDLKK